MTFERRETNCEVAIPWVAIERTGPAWLTPGVEDERGWERAADRVETDQQDQTDEEPGGPIN